MIYTLVHEEKFVVTATVRALLKKYKFKFCQYKGRLPFFISFSKRVVIFGSVTDTYDDGLYNFSDHKIDLIIEYMEKNKKNSLKVWKFIICDNSIEFRPPHLRIRADLPLCDIIKKIGIRTSVKCKKRELESY